MKKNTNAWLGLIIIGLLLLLFLDKCSKPNTQTDPSTTEVMESDTVRVTHIDTIPFYNIIDSIRWNTLPIISVIANEDSSEFLYTTSIKDSLIEGTIATTVKSTGQLVNQGFTYIPKFPKYIIKTDSIFVTNTITKTVENIDWGIYVGMDVSPYKQFALVPNIGLKTKKDMFFGLGYDPFNQSVYAQFKIKILGK